MMSPTSRSVRTSAQPPTAKMVATAAPTNAPTTWPNSRQVLGQELARGEREQLAVARGDGRAEHADPERQVLRERRGAGNAGLEESPRGDLRERQQHDAGEGGGGENVLRAERKRPHYRPLVLRNASRSRTTVS